MVGIAMQSHLDTKVTGSDTNVYSTNEHSLNKLGIELTVGFDTQPFVPIPIWLLFGNCDWQGQFRAV